MDIVQRDRRPHVFLIAWVASIAVAFVIGCGYPIFISYAHKKAPVPDSLRGFFDSGEVMLITGVVSAVAAAFVSATALAFVVWPLFNWAYKRNIRSFPVFFGGGMMVSLLIGLALFYLPQCLGAGSAPDDYFIFAAVIITGFVDTSILWSLVRVR